MTISEIAHTDSGKEYIATGKNGQVNAIYVPDLQYTVLGKFIIYRLKENRDVKILITGKGKTTGTGKTTLAIHLAHFVHNVQKALFDVDSEWSTEEYSFMNVWEYLESYKEVEPATPLITDELEYMADRRDHQTNENKKFSQAWSVLRWKNVVTIGTAPGLSDLEKRIPEGADIWLNVVHKGKANAYYLTVHDFEMSRIFKRLKLGGFKESILWNAIEDSDDYRWLAETKEDIGVPGIDDRPGDQVDESDLNQLEKNIRESHVKRILVYIDEKGLRKYFNQSEIGEIAGVSQSKVSEVENDMMKGSELSYEGHDEY